MCSFLQNKVYARACNPCKKMPKSWFLQHSHSRQSHNSLCVRLLSLTCSSDIPTDTLSWLFSGTSLCHCIFSAPVSPSLCSSASELPNHSPLLLQQIHSPSNPNWLKWKCKNSFLKLSLWAYCHLFHHLLAFPHANFYVYPNFVIC